MLEGLLLRDASRDVVRRIDFDSDGEWLRDCCSDAVQYGFNYGELFWEAVTVGTEVRLRVNLVVSTGREQLGRASDRPLARGNRK